MLAPPAEWHRLAARLAEARALQSPRKEELCVAALGGKGAADKSHLVQFSIDYWQQRKEHASPRGVRVKSYPWDIVKRVTGIYGDAFRQL